MRDRPVPPRRRPIPIARSTRFAQPPRPAIDRPSHGPRPTPGAGPGSRCASAAAICSAHVFASPARHSTRPRGRLVEHVAFTGGTGELVPAPDRSGIGVTRACSQQLGAAFVRPPSRRARPARAAPGARARIERASASASVPVSAAASSTGRRPSGPCPTAPSLRTAARRPPRRSCCDSRRCAGAAALGHEADRLVDAAVNTEGQRVAGRVDRIQQLAPIDPAGTSSRAAPARTPRAAARRPSRFR